MSSRRRDTRRAKILLGRYEIKTPVISYHEQGGKGRTAALLERLQEADVAPDHRGRNALHQRPAATASSRRRSRRACRWTCCPAPAPVSTALAVSGLPSHQFVFVGFPPRKIGERKRFLQSLGREARTLVLFEAPRRLQATLRDAAEGLRPTPDRRLPRADETPPRDLSRGPSTRQRRISPRHAGSSRSSSRVRRKVRGADDDTAESARRLLASLAAAGATGEGRRSPSRPGVRHAAPARLPALDRGEERQPRTRTAPSPAAGACAVGRPGTRAVSNPPIAP